METNNNIIVKLLTSPQWRIARHMVLFVFIIFISAGFIWHWEEDGVVVSIPQKYGLLLLFTSIFMIGSYLNIYVLTPRLLLKNKWNSYFIGLCVIVVLVMLSIGLIQSVFGNENASSQEINYFIILVNMTSSSLSLLLLFVGTGTLVLFKYWILDLRESEALASATLQMELKLLKNQINPHFLFNMLNNANIMVDEDPKLACKILKKLEDLLYYQLNDSSKDKVQLSTDILFLTDFLELEKTRRDHFEYSISREGDVDGTEIPPLLFIPFVENGVKHNSDSEKLAYVNISFLVDNKILTFFCENSKSKKSTKAKQGGIGLVNIKQRLDLLYGENYSLNQTETEITYTVFLTVKL